MLGYRIVEVKNGKVMSLFHGTNKSREIKLDTWNRADKKLVRDGSNQNFYTSGWHFLLTREDCENFFMKMFRIKTNRLVVPCKVRGNIRPKHPDGKGKPCFLADEIYISTEAVVAEIGG